MPVILISNCNHTLIFYVRNLRSPRLVSEAKWRSRNFGSLKLRGGNLGHRKRPLLRHQGPGGGADRPGGRVSCARSVGSSPVYI